MGGSAAHSLQQCPSCHLRTNVATVVAFFLAAIVATLPVTAVPVTSVAVDFAMHGSDWTQASCGSRRQQSPVNFNEVAEPADDFFSYQYINGQTTPSIGNDGRTIRLSLPGGRFGGVSIPNSQHGWFDLKHIDVRAGSDHTVRGQRAALEIQLVHEARERLASSPGADLVTVSILVNPMSTVAGASGVSSGRPSFLQQSRSQRGARAEPSAYRSPTPDEEFFNPALQTFVNAAPPVVGDHVNVANAWPLRLDSLVQGGTFFMYHGSETLPPCEERVLWLVKRELVYASDQQVQALVSRINETTNGAGNYRTLMPLNQREIKSWEARPWEAPSTTMAPLAVAEASMEKSRALAREAIAIANTADTRAATLSNQVDQFYSEQAKTTLAPGEAAAAAEIAQAIGDVADRDVLPAAKTLAKTYVGQEFARHAVMASR